MTCRHRIRIALAGGHHLTKCENCGDSIMITVAADSRDGGERGAEG